MAARFPFLSLARRVIVLLAAKAVSEAVTAAVSAVAMAVATATAATNRTFVIEEAPRKRGFFYLQEIVQKVSDARHGMLIFVGVLTYDGENQRDP